MVYGSICYSSLAHLYGRIYSCVRIHVFLLHLLSYWDKIKEWHWNMKLFVSAMTLLSNEIIFWATKKKHFDILGEYNSPSHRYHDNHKNSLILCTVLNRVYLPKTSWTKLLSCREKATSQICFYILKSGNFKWSLLLFLRVLN